VSLNYDITVSFLWLVCRFLRLFSLFWQCSNKNINFWRKISRCIEEFDFFRRYDTIYRCQKRYVDIFDISNHDWCCHLASMLYTASHCHDTTEWIDAINWKNWVIGLWVTIFWDYFAIVNGNVCDAVRSVSLLVGCCIELLQQCGT